MSKRIISRQYHGSWKHRPRCFHQEPLVPDNGGQEKDGTTVIVAIREYLSDILGAFMPGVYFTVYLLISALLFLLMVNGLGWSDLSKIIEGGLPILRLFMPFAVLVFCFFSYIIGSVFYRKDVKEPDTASALRTYRKSSDNEREGLAFDFKRVKGSPFKFLTRLFMEILFQVDYPYSRLKRYLETRNYSYLAEHIPWGGNNDKKFKQRSKMFINILKSRIHAYAPEEMPVIEKNEAHVRLMNSLWYAAKSIARITYVILAVLIVFYLGHDSKFGKPFFQVVREINAISPSAAVWFKPDFAFCLGVFSIIQLAIAWYIKRSIKQYFHYMRVREIMFILEIADTIDRTTNADMFYGLDLLRNEENKDQGEKA
jgi:hypothetical protein